MLGAWNVFLSANEDLLYVAYRTDGFVIYDISDKNNILEISRYKTPGINDGLKISKLNSLAYLGCSDKGI